jgi:hypothetical protein
MPKNINWLPILAVVGTLCLGLGLYSLMNKRVEYIPQTSQVQTANPVQTTNSNDLRDTYGRAGYHIFNKKTKTFMYTAEEFFRDSGKTSFDGLIFDQVPYLPRGLKYVGGRPLTAEDYRRLEGK